MTIDGHNDAAVPSPDDHHMWRLLLARPFLRAINVGGRNVRMVYLRELFESLGYQNAETFIASGNVIFDSTNDPRTLEKQIEDHLRVSLGYEVATFVRSASELAEIAHYHPFLRP